MLGSTRHIAGINKEIVSCFEKLFFIRITGTGKNGSSDG
jgi:hypothetical protein